MSPLSRPSGPVPRSLIARLALVLGLVPLALPAQETGEPLSVRLSEGESEQLRIPARRMGLEVYVEIPAAEPGVPALFQLLVEGQGPSHADIGLRLMEPARGPTVDSDLGASYQREELLFRESGSYRVEVFQLNDPPVALPISLSLKRVEATGLETGVVISGQTGGEFHSDFFGFELAGQDRQLVLLGEETDRNLELVLVDLEGEPIARDENDNGNGSAERFLLSGMAPGFYFAAVRERGASRGQAGYTIALLEPGVAYSPPEGDYHSVVAAKDGEPIDMRETTGGAALTPGRPVQEQLTPELPRRRHRIEVGLEPLLIDVNGGDHDLSIQVSGVFSYRADFDVGKERGHELLVLPYPGIYDLTVQYSRYVGEEPIPYVVRADPMALHNLQPGQFLDHSLHPDDLRLYRMQITFNTPMVLDVKGSGLMADSGDLLLTVYRRNADDTYEVQNYDSDLNGHTGYESVRLSEPGEYFLVVRQGAGTPRQISYRVELAENPVLSQP